MTDEELSILVDLEDPAHRRLMIAKFDAAAVTAELSVATENNDVVDYPSERDYIIQLYGDGYFVGRDDERYTPGDPDEATVTVQDNDTLVVVTVEPVTELVSTGESVQFRFRRTGSTAEALTISFQGFEHPSSGDATLADATVTFLAGNGTVVYTNDVTSNGTVNPSARAHTVLIYGDAGRGGLHRSWIAGDPNRATVVVGDNNSSSYMAMTASYPGRMAAGESVSVEYTVTNFGTRPLPGFSNRVWDGTKISTTPDRGSCDIRDDIPAGESRTCSASFTATNQDVTNGKIEFDATARNGSRSSTLHVYIRVAQPVEFGFTTADNLEVTEGPDVTATLPVTRTGRLNEAATVAYRLRKHGTRPASLGEDFTDPSSTPGLLTFPANVPSANIVINITQDQIDEERERFRVDLVPLADGTITEGKNSRVVRIADEHQDNDPYRPTASLQLVSSGPVPENEGPVEFAVVLDRVWGREGRYEVELLADQLTATPGLALIGKKGDFEDPLIVVARIPAGQTRFEFSVPLYDDDVREEDETFQLQLTSSYDDSFRTIGTSNRALATIADDDRVPPAEAVLSLSHNGIALESVPEGFTQQDITVTASFPQIRWPGDASNAPLRPADPRDVDTTVRVQFDPNSGATHAAGLDDFAPFKVEDDQGDFGEVESFDIVIPAGQTSGTATLRFKPVKDALVEEDETVTLQGSEMVGGGSENSLPVRSTSFTIIDDDARGITVSPASVLIALPLVEGGEAGTYSLVLDSQPTDTVVITLAGNQGGFLRLTPDTLTFTTSNWATPQTVSVMALDDGIAGGMRPQEWITHQVSGGDYGSETVPNISAIVEDTTEAFVYLEGGQASESDGHVEFTVTVRPILRTTPVLVRYTTVDDTAIAGSDYTREVETSQTYKILTIPAGQNSGAIRIPITDDQVYESANETFTLHLTNHNNRATLDGEAPSLTAIGAITDDDPKPVVSVSGPDGELSYVSETVKDPVIFTLTLMGQSAGDVTVDYATGEAGFLGLLTSRQGPAGATENEDYAGTSGSVTFTSGQTTKTVTVQVTNDDVSEETEFFGFKISKPQGADLRGQRSEDVADVGLLDDDARGVTIDPTSISLDEPASGETAVAGSYTVNLKSRPTDTVTVTIGGGDPAVSLSGDTLTNNQLSFTTTNWNTAQTITVTPVKDDNAVGETVTLTHTLSGGDYAGIAADSVTINLTDSDTPAIVLSKTDLAVTEGDAAGMSYTVALATQPSGSVSVSITGHAGTDLRLDKTSLTFTVNDWDDAQTVTVTAAEDDDGVTDAVATLNHTASGGDYVNVTRDLPVSVMENDSAGVTIEPTALSVVAGRSNEYTVALVTQPTGDVSVTISGHASTAVTLSSDMLTFTTGNWDDAQTITVSATESAATGKVTLAHAVAGADYASVTAEPVVVSVVAVAGQHPTIQVGVTSSTQTLTVPEGESNSYTLVLGSRPTGDVAIGVTLPAGTDLRLDKTSLTFTSTNWDDAQTVTVTAAEDDDGVTDAVATLAHTASGGGYASTTVPDVEVSITENDSAGVTIEPTALSVVAGRSNGYTVALVTQPTGDVSVTISGHASTAVTLSSDMLTFTTGNWDDAQTITVSATESAATGKVTLAHAVAGADYASVTAEPVVVSVVAVAGQHPTIQVGVTSSTQTLTVPEGGSNSYTLVLGSRPTGDVSIGVTLPAGTDLTLSSDTLTFTTGNWDTAQTVTVTAAEDDDGVTDAVATLTHTASGGGYASTTVPDVEVTVTENDTAAIVLSEPGLTLTEGDAVGSSYTVKLATKPSGTVSVSITGHADTDLSLDKTPLTFIVNDWDTPQTVTVEAGQDDDTVNDTATLTHTASGGDYANVTADLQVTVTDDDPQVTVQFGVDAYTVSEGSTTNITVTLSADPKSTVVIPLVASGQDGAVSDDYRVPSSVTINGGEMSKTFEFMAMADDADDAGESVMIGFGTNLPSRVTKGTPKETRVTINQRSMQSGSGVTVQFGSDAYTVSEGSTATITVTLSADPQSTVVIPITATNQDGATSDDYSTIPSSVTFNSGDTSNTITFSVTEDTEDELGESVLLAFGRSLPNGVSAGTPSQTTVSIRDDCAAVDIWCATVDFLEGTSPGAQRLYLNQIDNEVFTHNGVDYWLADIDVAQNDGRAPVDDINIKWQHGYPERTRFDLRIHSPDQRVNGHEGFFTHKDEWLDWTLHVSTVSDGETITTELRLSEAQLPFGSCCLMFFGRDIDDLRRTWQPGQIYKLRLVEDPRSERTSQPLKPPMYLGINEEVARLVPDAPWLARYTFLEWLAPQGRDDHPPPVDSYKVQWKQTSGSWDMDADISETITGPGHRRYHSYDLDGLTPGVEYNIRVIATDSVGDSEPSNEITYMMPVDAQHSISNTPAGGAPRIDGTPEAGQTLSADTTGITDADGLEGVVFNYQWLADDAAIAEANDAVYTVMAEDEGKAITVRVDFTDDAGNEETLASAPTVVTSADLEVRSATVDGTVLTLTYDEVLDNLVSVPQTAFAVNVNGTLRSVGGVGFGESSVLLFLLPAVAAGDTVTVGYTAPDDGDGIQDTLGRKANSFSGQAVMNYTDSVRLTASAHDAPESHDGATAFTFELRFSEEPPSGFSYSTVQNHALTVTDGSVSNVRRLEPGKNVRWEITVTPDADADATMALNATNNCASQGAICTSDGRKLSGGLELVVPGPTSQQSVQENSEATGAPTINGTAQVGETLTATTTGVSDADGLVNASFTYQWLADDTDISGATGSSYVVATADEGKSIKVQVSFTDDAGNAETLTSAATTAVAKPPLTATVHDKPSSHDGSAAFTFELRLSEDIESFSYTTLQQYALTVTGETLPRVRRLEAGKNVRWEITVQPSSNADVTIVLPITTDCAAQGAICTSDGRKLSSRVELTISGPSG